MALYATSSRRRRVAFEGRPAACWRRPRQAALAIPRLRCCCPSSSLLVIAAAPVPNSDPPRRFWRGIRWPCPLGITAGVALAFASRGVGWLVRTHNFNPLLIRRDRRHLGSSSPHRSCHGRPMALAARRRGAWAGVAHVVLVLAALIPRGCSCRPRFLSCPRAWAWRCSTIRPPPYAVRLMRDGAEARSPAAQVRPYARRQALFEARPTTRRPSQQPADGWARVQAARLIMRLATYSADPALRPARSPMPPAAALSARRRAARLPSRHLRRQRGAAATRQPCSRPASHRHSSSAVAQRSIRRNPLPGAVGRQRGDRAYPLLRRRLGLAPTPR